MIWDDVFALTESVLGLGHSACRFRHLRIREPNTRLTFYVRESKAPARGNAHLPPGTSPAR